MGDASLIKAVFPKHPVKLLSRLLGVPVGTAHEWVYRNLSATRRRELALALLEEFDRQDREERAAVRKQLKEMAGADNAMERSTHGGTDSAANSEPTSGFLTQHGQMARAVCGEVTYWWEV